MKKEFDGSDSPPSSRYSMKDVSSTHSEEDSLIPEKDPLIQTGKSINDPNLSSLGSIYNETEWPTPTQRYLHKFPISMERSLQPFDDYLMKVCQRANHRFFVYLNLFLTGTVAIETGIAAPFIFFVLGWDALGIEMGYLMIVLSFLSQIPKRFIWRFRPYMVGRARKTRKKESATTSSFPSRAVTCGVVYSFFICYAYIFYAENPSKWHVLWWMPFVLFIIVFLSSFARINLGVHYPSDCLFGVLQGILVCVLGTLLWRVNGYGCNTCYDDACYSPPDHAVTKHHLNRFNYLSLIICVVVGCLLTVVSSIKPLELWNKCDRIYGMLLSGIAFQVTLLCPRLVSSSLQIPHSPPWYSYLFGLGIALIATLIGIKNNGRYPMVSFLVLFSIMYFSVAVWRIWVV
eukprot:TRINITY_DN8089_c0_g1_i1.p1 TRINITY_DN8089_c0_g1~~TRINITY_DN8089_c0_g1_i1.p1  ORF type:complete len:402 (+),score=24.45 TRINITY_DN8089_c0_g1_i1:165-1370(+)